MSYPVLIPWPKVAAHVPTYQAGYSEDTISRPPTTPKVLPVESSTPEPSRSVRVLARCLVPPLFVYYMLKNLAYHAQSYLVERHQ